MSPGFFATLSIPFVAGRGLHRRGPAPRSAGSRGQRYNVAQRTRELGLRIAQGAEPGRLRRMVLKQVGIMGLVGGTLGPAAVLGLGRAAEALLYGVSGYDPRVLAAAAAVLAVVVLAASYLPARRASNVAPMEALRHE
ncbi:MAG TPA: FtsX-like permease family protein [Gammaproteobacteria bacterium]